MSAASLPLTLAAGRSAWRRHAALWGVVLLPTLYLLLLYVLPAAILLGYSFWSIDRNYKLVPAWNLGEYRYFLTQPAYSLLLVRSFRMALLNTVISLAIAYPLAYVLAYAVRGRWKNLLLVMLIAPSWTSFLIRIYAWMLILGDNGLINFTLQGLRLTREPLPLLFNQTSTWGHRRLSCRARVWGSNHRAPAADQQRRGRIPRRRLAQRALASDGAALAVIRKQPMNPTLSTYVWPGPVHFGFGAARLVGQEARARQARHVFVVADRGVVEAGLVEPVLDSLRAAGLATSVYDQVMANPDGASVEAAAQAFRDSGADLIAGAGGGSVLDTAKAVRLLAGSPGARIAEFDLFLGEKVRPAPQQMPPLMAVPTTAGTGSEVTAWAVVTDPARKLKTSVGGPFLIPSLALVDPELMLTLPPHLTAATGMDALSHCIESYVSTTDHPLVDQMALYGIELIGRSLRVAVAQGGQRAARRDMALAAMIGGMALNSKWGGACHSVAHQLSTFAGVHHGVANALMLPYQMRYSLIGALEKYARIGEALGVPPVGTVQQRAEQAVEAVRQLSAEVGLPARLSDVGVTEAMIPAMAANAYIDDSWATNPRAVSEAAMAQWYREAF